MGTSYRTKLLGIVLLVLGAIGVGIGGIFTIWHATRDAGYVFITQGIFMLTTGVGFILARDHAASEQRARQLSQRIEHSKAEVREEVKETILPEAKEVAQRTAAAEVREAERRDRR